MCYEDYYIPDHIVLLIPYKTQDSNPTFQSQQSQSGFYFSLGWTKMCTVTLLSPLNTIQADVKTFNLLFIILSHHHTLPRSHFSPQPQSILALRVACFLSLHYPNPPPLPPRLHPVLLSDTQQIHALSHTHALSKCVLKLFDFQLGCPEEWRPCGSLLTTWQTAASTMALPKGGELRCLCEPNASVYFKNPCEDFKKVYGINRSVAVKLMCQPIWHHCEKFYRSSRSYSGELSMMNYLKMKFFSMNHALLIISIWTPFALFFYFCLRWNAVMIIFHNEKSYKYVLLEQPNSKSHFMEIISLNISAQNQEIHECIWWFINNLFSYLHISDAGIFTSCINGKKINKCGL